MKKLFTLATLLVFSTSALAGFSNDQNRQSKGGFSSASLKQSRIATVARAKRANEDTYVTLQGYIIEKIGKEKYTFKDKTGSIRVEIDEDIWRGLTVTPKTKVTIYGKVDNDDGRVEIDVKRISKAK